MMVYICYLIEDVFIKFYCFRVGMFGVEVVRVFGGGVVFGIC